LITIPIEGLTTNIILLITIVGLGLLVGEGDRCGKTRLVSASMRFSSGNPFAQRLEAFVHPPRTGQIGN
jgi:hypothetical protein